MRSRRQAVPGARRWLDIGCGCGLAVWLLLALAVIFFNGRYLYWRIFDTLPVPALSPAFFWSALVLAAEALAIVQVSLHTLLFIRLSDRREEADAYEAALRGLATLPTVDVFIPTVNEGWDILKRSIRAAIDLDWPLKPVRQSRAWWQGAEVMSDALGRLREINVSHDD